MMQKLFLIFLSKRNFQEMIIYIDIYKYRVMEFIIDEKSIKFTTEGSIYFKL